MGPEDKSMSFAMTEQDRGMSAVGARVSALWTDTDALSGLIGAAGFPANT